MATRSTSKPRRKRGPRPKAPPTLIGWREWAAFPEFGVERIKAKIDTGAKTSAVHAFKVRTIERDGALWAEFRLHPEQKRKRPEIRCLAPIVDRRRIRSSNGRVEERLVVRTVLALGGREWPIEISLANRDEMGFRLLLGRDAFAKDFVINPGKSFLLGK